MPFFQQWEKQWFPISQEIYQLNYSKRLPALQCPIFFMIGKKDYQTNFKVSEQYYNKLKTPIKRLF